MHLFLQGDKSIGKSTLLRQALARQALVPGGFVTQRLLENGVAVGFRAVALQGGPPPLEVPYTTGLTGVFLLKGQRDSNVLTEVLAQTEQLAAQQHCQLLLLDEIGGIELTNARFMQCLRRILNNSTPCLGVLKSAANLAHTVKDLRQDTEYQALHEDLAQLLRKRGEVLTLHASNREEIRQRVDNYLAAVKGARP